MTALLEAPPSAPPVTRVVRIPERDAHWGRVGPPVVVHELTIYLTCPHCGRLRAEPQHVRRYHDGEWFSYDQWENRCGHVDIYEWLLRAAGRIDVSHADRWGSADKRLTDAVRTHPWFPALCRYVARWNAAGVRGRYDGALRRLNPHNRALGWHTSHHEMRAAWAVAGRMVDDVFAVAGVKPWPAEPDMQSRVLREASEIVRARGDYRRPRR